MKNINKKTEFIEKILGIISLEKGLAQNTIIAYKKDISLAFDWFEKNNIDFLMANEKDFQKLFFVLKNKNYKPSTLSRKLSSLKQFYSILKEEAYINTNPINNLVPVPLFPM